MRGLILIVFILIGCNGVVETDLGVDQYVPPTTEEIAQTISQIAYVGINDGDRAISESAVSPSTVLITSNTTAEQDIYIPYTLTNTNLNAATLNVDYTLASPDSAIPGMLIIPAGQAYTTIDVTMISDSMSEGNETIIFSLGTPQNGLASLSNNSIITMTITDSDSLPSVTFTTVSQSVAETVGSTVFQIDVSNQSSTQLDIPFILEGKAQGPGSTFPDYSISGLSNATIVGGTIIIPAQALSAFVTVTVTNDSSREVDEDIAIILQPGLNYYLGSAATHTITIGDDEGPPVVTIRDHNEPNAALQLTTLGENAGSFSFLVKVEGLIDEDINVPYSVLGTSVTGTGITNGDHNLSSGLLTIPAAGSGSSLLITKTIFDDVVHEGIIPESIIIVLGTPDKAVLNADPLLTKFQIDITDNEALPEVQFETPVYTAYEPSTITNNILQRVRVRLSGTDTSAVPITVGVKTGVIAQTVIDGDTSISNGAGTIDAQIVIPAGQLTGELLYYVRHDEWDEDDETLIFDIVTVDNGFSCGVPSPTCFSRTTVNILDNDEMPTVGFSTSTQAVKEGTSATVHAKLDKISGRDVTVNVNTITNVNNIELLGAGTDYTMPAGWATGITYSNGGSANPFKLAACTTCQILIPAGALSASVTFPTLADGKMEYSESFILSLSSAVNAVPTTSTNISHTVTLVDEDTLPTVYILNKVIGDITSAGADKTTALENVGTIDIMVQLSDVTDFDVQVPIQFHVDSTAIFGAAEDYTLPILPTIWDANDKSTWVVTIPAGSTSADISIPIFDDTVYEHDEKLIIEIGDVSNALKADQNAILTDDAFITHELTINSDELPPTIRFKTASQSPPEGAGFINVEVELFDGLSPVKAGKDISVPIDITGFNLIANHTDNTLDFGVNEDYSLPASFAKTGVDETWRVVIPAGETSASAQFFLRDDSDDEHPSNHEELVVILDAARDIQYESVLDGALAFSTPLIHTASVIDNDGVPQVAFEIINQATAESSGSVDVKVLFTGRSYQAMNLTMGINLLSTAIKKSFNPDPLLYDYDDAAVLPNPIIVSPGLKEVVLNFPINDEAVSESAETFIVEILNVTNAFLDPILSKHTVTITDNENLPVVSFALATNPPLAEGVNPTFSLTAVLEDPSKVSSASIFVPVTGISGSAIVDKDYTFPPTWIVGNPSTWLIEITPGTTSGTVVFTLNNDDTPEPTEYLTFAMGVPTNATAGYTTVSTFEILPDVLDLDPNIQFDSVTQTLVEDTVTISIPVSLSKESGFNTKVRYKVDIISTSPNMTSPFDYSITEGFVQIAAGGLSGNIIVSFKDDSSLESTENLVIELVGASSSDIENATLGANTTHTIVVLDNDLPPNISFESDFIEIVEPLNGAEKEFSVKVILDNVSFRDVFVEVNLSTLTGNGFANVDTVANGCNPGTDFLFPTEWTPLGNPSQTLATSPGPVNVVNVVGFMIMAGQTEHILKFKVCGDAVYEIEEQYALTLGSIYDPNAITDTTAIFGALPIYTIYIQDGGVKPNISFTTPSQIIPEDIAGTGSGNTATMSVSLNVVSDYDIKVPIASIAGYGSDQATTPADFTFPAGWNTNNNVNHVITIPAGSLSADTIFTIVSDTQIEKTEAFESVMGQPYIINPNQYTISKGNVTAHVVYIGADTGDDEVPDVYFASTSLYVNESEGSISPYIQLTEETAFTVLVAYQVTGFANPSEAEVDKDYILYDGILEIQPGQTIVAMPPIPILDDYDYEYDEGFKITIVSAANADFGAGATNPIHQTADYAEITIVNDDALPQIAFSLDYPVVQDQVEPSIARQEVYETPGSGGTEVKVKLVTNGTHVASMEVGFSIMGTATQADLPVGCPGVPTVANNRDYRLPLHTDCANTWTDQNNMKVTFAPGETEKEVSFMIYDDYLYEMAETIIISMLAPSNALIGGVDTHIITITDTDPLPKPTFTTINQVVYEPKMCTSLNNNWGGVPATIPSLEGMDIDCDTPADVTKISTLKLSGLKEVLIKIKTYIVPESKIVIPIRDIIGDAVINGDYLLPSSWNNFPYQVSGQPIFSHPTWYIELDPFEPGVCTHLPTDLVSSYGDCTAEVKFTILDDNIYEADDTISISMGIPYLYDPNVQTPIQFDQYGNPIGSLYAAVALDAGSIQTTDITILNDTTGLITKDQGGLPVKNDPPPTVKFKVASQALDEFDDTSPFSECSSVAGRQVVVSFELDEISSFGSLINIGLGEYEEGAAISGPKSSAKPGFDHDLQANTFFMNAGVKEDYQTFCILDDVLTEGMEEIVMTLANPINAVVSTNPVDLIHRVQIKHNDPIKVVAGVSHTCAIISERLKCWGNNSYGQLGLDTVFYSTSVTTPVKKFVNLGTDSLGDYIVKDVTLGAEHTCVLLEFPSAQGTLGVKCFGRNTHGQTGIATIENAGNIGDSSIEMGNALQFLRFGDDFSLTPLQPTKVVSGGNFTCVLFSSGDMKCFGENTYGQLGRNDKVHRGLVSGSIELMDPIDVGTNWSGAVDIAVTGHSACALGSNRARCWGRNEASELGITSCVTGVGGGTINYNSLISSLPQTCSSIGDEPNEMDGSAWGMDDYARASNYGHAGLGFEWLIGPNNITGASNGYSYCMDHLGFKTCFGYNAFGILGRDHTTNIGHDDLNYLQEYQSDPAVELSPNNGNGFYNVYGTSVETDALEVSMGYEHSCALLMNGEVKCLGRNTLGQNGTDQAVGYNFGGTSTQLFENTTSVLLFNDVQDISAGQFYTCAVEGSNKVKCWGSNGNGQLGIGNTTASFGIGTSPRQMSDIPFIVFPALDQREVTLE